MMVVVTMMVNVCDDDCNQVMKVILVKEVMSCDVSPMAMFISSDSSSLRDDGQNPAPPQPTFSDSEIYVYRK